MAQPAHLKIRLIDSSGASPSDYIFEIEVKNDSFPMYWVQDTSILKHVITNSGPASIVILVYKIVDGKLQPYPGDERERGDAFIPDSSKLFCSPCIFLNRGESLKLRWPLLKKFKMEKGEYTIGVNLYAPEESCDRCKQLMELSGRIILRVGDKPK
jgi:hypothetical protein